MTVSGQHGFMEGKAGLTNLTAFFDDECGAGG